MDKIFKAGALIVLGLVVTGFVLDKTIKSKNNAMKTKKIISKTSSQTNKKK